MGDRLDVVVVGDVNPDLILTGDVEPVFGQTERLVDGARLTVGGSGAITACAAARLGLRVAICGVVGDDVLGRFMRQKLEARGVDTRPLRTGPGPTGVSVILARYADRAILTYPGAIASPTAADVDPDLVASARHVHVSSFFLQTGLAPGVARLFADARVAGITTSLDPNHDPTGAWNGGLRDALAHTDVFLPNEKEAIAISGEETVRNAAAALIAIGPGAIAIKAGGHGAVGITPDEVVGSPAVESGGAVDSTGAGDCFDAGFLAAWLDGAPLADALRVANACGSLSTRALGGVDAQPTMDEVRRALAAAAP